MAKGQQQQPQQPGEVDAVAAATVAAAERFVASQGVTLTCKRLLYEFLAYPCQNGKTASGLRLNEAGEAVPAPELAYDVVYATRKFVGYHIIKHYYLIRQYKEASGTARRFLMFLRSEAALPAGCAVAKDLDAAIAITDEAVQQLERIYRLERQPCALNEAWARVYPLRPFPLCMVPCSALVKSSGSRYWPETLDQAAHAWLSFAEERTRVPREELQAIVADIPRNLTILRITEGRWEVLAVSADNKVSLREIDTKQEFTVAFHAKRAADFMVGMVMGASVVTMSDGSVWCTDWGYIFPTYYAPVMDHPKHTYGHVGVTRLVYAK